MDTKRYVILGHSYSGKTTVGNELRARGHAVLEMDEECNPHGRAPTLAECAYWLAPLSGCFVVWSVHKATLQAMLDAKLRGECQLLFQDTLFIHLCASREVIEERFLARGAEWAAKVPYTDWAILEIIFGALASLSVETAGKSPLAIKDEVLARLCKIAQLDQGGQP